MSSYSDDDFEALATGRGVLKPALGDMRSRFEADGRESLTEFIAELKASGEAAHFWPEPEPGEGIDPALIEAACGSKPTLAARAKLLKIAGDGYPKILAAWGASANTLAPGKNPKVSNEKVPDKKPHDHSNNPFHKSQWNVTKQGALIKTLGLDKANAIAKSVGSHVGATRPNADY
jgi:hypothetical protein